MINLFIGGKFRKPSSGEYKNGAAAADEKDLQFAIEAAKKSQMPAADGLRKMMLEFADLFEKQKSDFALKGNDFDEAMKSVYYYAGAADKWKEMYLSGNDYKYISVKSPVIYRLQGKINLTGIITSIFRPVSCGAPVIIIVPAEFAKVVYLLSLIFLNMDVPAGTINFLTGLNTKSNNILEIAFTDNKTQFPEFEREVNFINDIVISKPIEI